MAGVRKRPAAAASRVAGHSEPPRGRGAAAALKRPAASSAKRREPAPQPPVKRRRKSKATRQSSRSCALSVPLNDIKDPCDKLEAALKRVESMPPPHLRMQCCTTCCIALTQALREKPFGMWAEYCDWEAKQRLYSVLGRLVPVNSAMRCRSDSDQLWAAVETEYLMEFVNMIDQLLHSGYAPTTRDRHSLVLQGVWRPLIEVLRRKHSDWRLPEARTGGLDSDGFLRHARTRNRAMRLYVYMADHIGYNYDHSKGLESFKDFWKLHIFDLVLAELLQEEPLYSYNPEILLSGQWEMLAADIEASLKYIQTLLVAMRGQEYDVVNRARRETMQGEVMRYMEKIFDKLAMVSNLKNGRSLMESSGGPLEGLIKVSGLIISRIMTDIEDSRFSNSNPKRALIRMSKFLQKLLLLDIPTCASTIHPHDGQGSHHLVPVDERQQDADWLEMAVDHAGIDNVLDFDLMSSLFKAMAKMTLEEQRYRLDCLSPLVSPFIAKFGEQLQQNVVPPELANLKIVINAVLQDHGDGSLASDLLEEVSFYPCLLEFATKRAGIQAACQRLRLQSGVSDPIRLVVPRDNVLDGVCSTLHLGSGSEYGRIDSPLEIEFRAGYADDSGNEVVDEGEDQGGLRRQWLDRASRHFIQSDLFMSPAEDASHLTRARASSSTSHSRASERVAKGVIFVPSPESVCQCVQEDWKEQFELFGCILGFAIMYKETIPVHLGHNFLRAVFGVRNEVEDAVWPLLEHVDKTLHTKLKYIFNGSYKLCGHTLQEALEYSNLPQSFSFSESHCPELVRSTPLKENGDQILVTEENKKEFVQLLMRQVLKSGIETQVKCFRRGLHRVIPEDIVQRMAELMTVKEIELMVCGADEIDVEDWQKNTQYENGYTADSRSVRWFWEVVHTFSSQSRAALLSFATGSAQVPSGGFRFLQPELFTIQRVPVTDRLPEAHTCANTVDLPEYSSRKELERCLRFAIEETGDVFGRR